MATLHERGVLASDPTFILRTRQAVVRYASYLTQQAEASPTDLRMAKSVLGAPDRWAEVYAVALSQEPDVLNGQDNDPAADTDAGDAALIYAVEQRAWPAFAAEVEGDYFP